MLTDIRSKRERHTLLDRVSLKQNKTENSKHKPPNILEDAKEEKGK
jgi:hypothetical protein